MYVWMSFVEIFSEGGGWRWVEYPREGRWDGSRKRWNRVR